MANEVRINVTSRDNSGPGFKSAKANADGLGDSTRRVGEIASGIIAAGVFERLASAAKQAFVATVNAASNLNESINAVNVTFGSSAEEVLAIGKNADQSMGLSQRAFNEAAVSMANFAKAVAGEGGDVAGVIEGITQRSADFASVMNLDVNESLDLFRSGLAGESEPLRKYGIDVSAAAVETFAYANGIAAAGTELTEQEKIQARYGLIMEQTSAMQGDFANTSDDMANATRRAGAELENAQASMGDNLLPVMGELASLASDVLVGFQQLPGPVQAAIGIIAGLGATAAAAAVGLRALGISLTAVKAALGPIGIALAIGGALIAGLAALGKNSEKATGDVDGLAQTLERGTGAITAATREAVLLELQQKGLAGSARDLNLATEDVVNAYLGEEDALRKVIPALDEIIEKGTTTREVNKGHKEGIVELKTEMTDEAAKAQELKDAIKDGNLTTEEAIVLAKDLGIVTGETATATEQASEAMIKAATEIADSWEEAMLDIADAQEAYSDAQDELKEGEELTTAAFIEAFEKRVKAAEDHNENMVKIQRRTSEGVYELMGEDLKNNPELAEMIANATGREFSKIEDLYEDSAKAANKAANREMVNNIPELKSIAKDSGQGFAEKLAGAIRSGGKLTFGEVKTIMEKSQGRIDRADLMAIIESQLDEGDRDRVERLLDNLARDRSVELNITENRRVGFGPGSPNKIAAHGGIIGSEGMASGGIAGMRGNQVLVGEHRPEVVELPFGSRVIPSVDQAMDRNQVTAAGARMPAPGYVLTEDGTWVPESFFQARRVREPKPGFVEAEDGSWVPETFYEADRRAVPEAGMVRAEDGSWVPKSFYEAETVRKLKPGFVVAEDGTWVPKSFHDSDDGTLNTRRKGPRGQREWDFFIRGGKSYARIFDTGETIPLGNRHEDEAFEYLKRIGKLHDGGVVPGAPGTEKLAILEAGEQVIPAGGGGGAMTIVIESGGSRMDDLLVEVLRRSIRIKGGNVQTVLGAA